ncbi:hypothetical protein CFC21_054209 [Triticum aestivum]|uniref:At1g61320/AtMIF1 LRR domain-containing protein n=2 Tax=Triticum aestivum TaxID=4565 RepID=A0A9R1GCH4_WHEAT|nr:uncharacterized protein LOC123082688 [Triticum aestivum]KAF7045063.1 hypothetical protein CFC21_054209 [Triticum aestivum]
MDRFQQSKNEDRLTTLTDDVLLNILGRVGLCTAARTSALSTRWRQLPWLLPELSIDVKDFLRAPHADPVEEDDMLRAMASLTQAVRCLFTRPRRRSTVIKLQLNLYLIDCFSRDIGPLLSEAIDAGLLKDLDLTVLDETDYQCYQYMRSLAKRMHESFSAYPSVPHCLTRLSLCNMCFEQLDMHHILFDCCKQLKHLTMSNCDAGCWSLLKIDAPNSNLKVLELDDMCCFERIEVVCLPKLEKLHWDTWISEYAPLSFGFAPSLVELHLSNAFKIKQHELKLSQLLHGAGGIHTLTLDFRGENIWLQPEIKELSSTFSKLRKLFILEVFFEFDLLWITAFLEAAPSVEILHIGVHEHVCEFGIQSGPESFPETTNPQWEMDFGGSTNLLLKELQIVGFRPLEQQLTFIRAILERAPNLRTVVLKDVEHCDDCNALALSAQPGALPWPVFPKNKDERDTVVRRVMDGTSFSGRIIFM